ncbi:hypothetical protein EDB84DRAFT_1594359 [Lactarius hengduanensis]|nr:hypothetical protein EDB84DRAFT_1594359 [Lactarius hengduanensis]
MTIRPPPPTAIEDVQCGEPRREAFGSRAGTARSPDFTTPVSLVGQEECGAGLGVMGLFPLMSDRRSYRGFHTTTVRRPEAIERCSVPPTSPSPSDDHQAATSYRDHGCAVCRARGMRGRAGVTSLFPLKSGRRPDILFPQVTAVFIPPSEGRRLSSDALYLPLRRRPLMTIRPPPPTAIVDVQCGKPHREALGSRAGAAGSRQPTERSRARTMFLSPLPDDDDSLSPTPSDACSAASGTISTSSAGLATCPPVKNAAMTTAVDNDNDYNPPLPNLHTAALIPTGKHAMSSPALASDDLYLPSTCKCPPCRTSQVFTVTASPARKPVAATSIYPSPHGSPLSPPPRHGTQDPSQRHHNTACKPHFKPPQHHDGAQISLQHQLNTARKSHPDASHKRRRRMPLATAAIRRRQQCGNDRDRDGTRRVTAMEQCPRARQRKAMNNTAVLRQLRADDHNNGRQRNIVPFT